MSSALFFRRNFLFGIMIFVLFLICPSVSFALFGGKVKSFSADYVMIDTNGKVVSSMKIYLTPDASRTDGMIGMMPEKHKTDDISTLTLKKENKVYIYNHTKKLVFETTEDEGKDYMNMMKSLEASSADKEKVLGKEKVSGYKCVKKEIETSYSFMGVTNTSKNIVWKSERFDIPLKTQDDEGIVTELRNIKPGKPSKKVFKPIEGYKKVGDMMTAMGMDIGSMMKDDDETEPEPKSTGKDMDKTDKKAVEEAVRGLGDALKNFKFN